MNKASLYMVAMLTIATGNLFAQVDEYNLPEPVSNCVAAIRNRDFEISDRINPFYLRLDLDGDRKADYAVLITQIKSTKQGILVCFAKNQLPIRIGAGTNFAFEPADQSDDISIFDAWNVEEPSRTFSKDRIHLVAKESASGWIYWDGKQLRWKQGAI